MPTQQVLTDVPAEDVARVVAEFMAAGATSATPTRQPDGNFTITAVFP